MSSETMINVTDASFQSDVVQYKGLVLVAFWAEWCGPCKQMKPVLGELANEMVGKIRIARVNVDENQSVPAELNVRGIPTLVLFEDGRKLATKVGGMTVSALKDWIMDNASSAE